MHDLTLRLAKNLWMNNLKCVFSVSCCLVGGSLSCLGQPSSLTPQVLAAQQQVKWTIGPVKADLGKVAEMDVPEGYRLTDAAGARVLLERMKNPVPAGLVGILMPENGTWWAVLEFNNLGYVQPSTTKWLQADAILSGMQSKIEGQNKFRAKQGAAPITSINWEVAPEYNAASDSLTYALQIAAGTDQIVNQSFRLFGRTGVLVATVVQKANVEKIELKELLKTASFKTGQRYGDFIEGDKLATVDIYQMITGDEYNAVSPKKGLAGFFDRRTTIWTLSGLAVCVVALVGYLVTKEIRGTTPQKSFSPKNAPFALANGKPRAVRRSAKTADAAGRRRTFDYQKFYSNMLMQVSSRSYTSPIVNNQEAQPADALKTAAANSVSAVLDAQKGAASELIARQKDFIEEQRRLMVQQTKLIEERSKLIEEKNQLLAKQSEMMENHLL